MASPEEIQRRAVAEAIRQGKLIFALRKELATLLGGTGTVLTSDDVFTPVLLEAGKTFTVPENKQVLWNEPIDVEGTLDVDGYLIYVNATSDPGGILTGVWSDDGQLIFDEDTGEIVQAG